MTDTTLTQGELDDLAAKLDQVEEIAVRLSYASQGHSASRGPTRRSQPGSRPPYSLELADLRDELLNELTTTVRHICEHRAIETPALSPIACARWLKKHRVALATMADGREIHAALCTVIEKAIHATVDRSRDDYGVIAIADPQRLAKANRQVVTGYQAEALAPKLGEQAKGLTSSRVRYLRRSCGLPVERKDEDTGTYFYRLGDVLKAHAEARAWKQSASRG